MKGVEFEKRSKFQKSRLHDYRILTEEIISHERSACEEMFHIYEKLTGVAPHGPLSYRFNELYCGDIIYIYCYWDIWYYGPNEEVYPVEDKTLWPWNRIEKDVTTFPKDVWVLILRRCTFRQLMRFARTSRYFLELVKDERCWALHREKLLRYIPMALRPLIQCNGSMFEFITALGKIYKKPKLTAASLSVHWFNFVCNLVVPFGNVFTSTITKFNTDNFSQRVEFLYPDKHVTFYRRKRKQTANMFWDGRRFKQGFVSLRLMIHGFLYHHTNCFVDHLKIMSVANKWEEFQRLKTL